MGGLYQVPASGFQETGLKQCWGGANGVNMRVLLPQLFPCCLRTSPAHFLPPRTAAWPYLDLDQNMELTGQGKYNLNRKSKLFYNFSNLGSVLTLAAAGLGQTAILNNISRWAKYQNCRQQTFDGSRVGECKWLPRPKPGLKLCELGLVMIRLGRSLLQQADASAMELLPVSQTLSHFYVCMMRNLMFRRCLRHDVSLCTAPASHLVREVPLATPWASAMAADACSEGMAVSTCTVSTLLAVAEVLLLKRVLS